MLQVGIAITMDGTAGVITATKFVGEGSQLTGVSGLGTALSNTTTNLSKIFFVNQTLISHQDHNSYCTSTLHHKVMQG